MRDDHHIEDLFQDAFQQFEADVPADAWGNIQQGLQAAPAGSTGASGSAAGSGSGGVLGLSKGLLSGLIIGVGAAGVAVAVYLTTPTDSAESALSQTAQPAAENAMPAATTPVAATPDAVVSAANDEVPGDLPEAAGEPAETTDSSAPSQQVSGGLQQAPDEAGTPPAATPPGPAPTGSSAGQPSTDPGAMEAGSPQSTSQGGDTTKAADLQAEEVRYQLLEALRASIFASPIGGRAPLDVQFSIDQPNREIVAWEWDFNDQDAGSDEAEPFHTFYAPGIYQVAVQLTDANGEQTRVTSTIEVLPQQPIRNADTSFVKLGAPVFTPNGDGTADEYRVDTRNLKFYEITISARTGQPVFHSNDPQQAWDGRDRGGSLVPAGTYFVLVTAAGTDGRRYQERTYLQVFR
ncbi:MAG: gliding motility-associated C-terminal domain-containing protein [Bacteroidota bacterium]